MNGRPPRASNLTGPSEMTMRSANAATSTSSTLRSGGSATWNLTAMTQTKEIDVARNFTPYPVGRTRSDGRHSGEAFRDDYLVPALKAGAVTVAMDGAKGYGSSFLEEAFGGLVRLRGEPTREEAGHKDGRRSAQRRDMGLRQGSRRTEGGGERPEKCRQRVARSDLIDALTLAARGSRFVRSIDARRVAETASEKDDRKRPLAAQERVVHGRPRRSRNR